MLALALNIKLVKATLITVPDDFLTIQEAINGANAGDSIHVKAGTYYENIVVNKSVSLIGENITTTIIDGNKTGDCVHVATGNVEISELTIQNGGLAYSSVRISSSGNSIVNNSLIGSWCGIYLEHYCDNDLFANNTIANNMNGIYGELWHNSKIVSNTITDNLLGILIGPYSDSNIISFNNIRGHWTQGISMWQSSQNTFEGNNITDNNQAGWASGIIIGFQTGFSSGNKFFHNNIANSGKRIELQGEQEPIIWDNGYPSGGNYWNDYNGTDLYSGPQQNMIGSDGTGDTPYNIDTQNTDNYPLTKPYGWNSHDIGITYVGKVWSSKLMPLKTVVALGYAFHLNAFVVNYGALTEVFNVTVYANTSAICTQENVALRSRKSIILNLTCNTTGFAYGNYALWASIHSVVSETDTSNNNFTIGNIHLTIPGDFNGNFEVCGVDFALFLATYGSTPSKPRWNPNCDVNDDNKAGPADFAALSVHYGQYCP